ncbi:MAG TPA: hypothetical protein VGI04_02790 [Neobacillus sp.]
MKTPNYHDFYQKALIPIGLNDLMVFQASEPFLFSPSSTHWLIAVEGVQLPQAKIYYHWKVSIYPADCDGDFNWKKPFYCSPAIVSIDDANDLAREFITHSQNDQLYTNTLQEKIG